MAEVGTASVPLSMNKGAVPQTGFVNLARANRFQTTLGWAPVKLLDEAGKEIPVPKGRERPELTADNSAVIASLLFPAMDKEGKKLTDVKAGKKIVVSVDCSLHTKKYWSMMAATPALHELFIVSGPTHFPPGWEGVPELTLIAKKDIKASDVPLAAVYLMLLA